MNKKFFLESIHFKDKQKANNNVENLSLSKKSSDESGHCRKVFVRSLLFFHNGEKTKKKYENGQNADVQQANRGRLEIQIDSINSP